MPFVCGATDLGEALRRIAEGAAMIRTKGEAGTGNVVEAVRHMRTIRGEIARLSSMSTEELLHGGQGAPRARTSWSRRWPVMGGCRWSTSRRAASRPRPTPR